MGQKQSRREAELYKRCDEVLHYLWDPIGVSGTPAARDEYDSYLPHVFALLKDDATESDIAAYLLRIETQEMSLPGNRLRIRDAVETLVRWRALIWERFSNER